VSRPDDQIEGYLRDLRRALRAQPLRRRRIVAEAEEHLRAAQASAVRSGLTSDAAADDAISRFGSARAVAAAHADERTSSLGRQLRIFIVAATAAAALLVGFDRHETAPAQAQVPPTILVHNAPHQGALELHP
jgi:hypothetical protein